MGNKTLDKHSPSKRDIYTVDSFAHGISFGKQTVSMGEDDPRDALSLRIPDDNSVIKLRSRYVLHKHNPLHQLELGLIKLSRKGKLSSAVIYLGTLSDPFFPFEGKFDASMKFLELFQRYTPGLLKVQTRSPLIVLAMPVLKKLGKHAAVTIGIETSDEYMAHRYTPGLPKISERLQAARALKRFGVEVTAQVSPLLPYGDWRKDTLDFAHKLDDVSNYIHLQGIVEDQTTREAKIRSSRIARRLATDRKFHWLRPDASEPLRKELQSLCPDKLELPKRAHLEKRQLGLFAEADAA